MIIVWIVLSFRFATPNSLVATFVRCSATPRIRVITSLNARTNAQKYVSTTTHASQSAGKSVQSATLRSRGNSRVATRLSSTVTLTTPRLGVR